MDIDTEYNSIVNDKFNDLSNNDAKILKKLKNEYDNWIDPDELISIPIDKSICEITNIFNNIRKIDRKSLTIFLSEASDRDLPKNTHIFANVSELKRLEIIEKMGENLRNLVSTYNTNHQ
jgi:hypothetical protein